MKAHRRQWTDMANTLFDKVWDTHEIAELPGGVRLLHIDRHWLHELTGVAAMEQVEQRGVPIRNPELTFATLDHRSEEHTSELQSLMRIPYAVFCLKKKKQQQTEE